MYTGPVPRIKNDLQLSQIFQLPNLGGNGTIDLVVLKQAVKHKAAKLRRVRRQNQDKWLGGYEANRTA